MEDSHEFLIKLHYILSSFLSLLSPPLLLPSLNSSPSLAAGCRLLNLWNWMERSQTWQSCCLLLFPRPGLTPQNQGDAKPWDPLLLESRDRSCLFPSLITAWIQLLFREPQSAFQERTRLAGFGNLVPSRGDGRNYSVLATAAPCPWLHLAAGRARTSPGPREGPQQPRDSKEMKLSHTTTSSFSNKKEISMETQIRFSGSMNTGPSHPFFPGVS